MASKWDTVELGTVATVKSGYAFKSRDWTDAGVPVVKIANVKSGRLDMDGCSFITEPLAASVPEAELKPKDILIAMTGYIGDTALVSHDDLPAMLNQRVGRFGIKDHAQLDWRYFFFVLRSDDVRSAIEGLGYGSAQPNVSPKLIQSVQIPLPPLPVQQRIADVLGKLDDKIELNRRMNRTLEKMAAAIFKSWFIEFDPTRAKAEGRDPNLPAEIADLFPDTFEDSDLGPIPKGWTVGVLEELASIKGGKQLPAHRRSENGDFPVFGANGIMGYCNECTHQGFVIAFGRVGAYCGSIHWALGGAWINNNASAVVPKKHPQYVLRHLLSTDFTSLRTGSAQPFIPNSALAQLPVILPQPRVLDAFEATVCQFAARASTNEQQNRTLAGLRDTLLPKLLSGEIELPEAEAIAEEVA